MEVLRYEVENGWIVGKNVENPICANRAIYCANMDVQVLAGDLPLIRLGHARHILGSLRLYTVVSGEKLYLDEAEEIIFAYRPSQVRWEIRDSRLSAPVLLEAGVGEESFGYVLKVTAQGTIQLGWQYGGLKTNPIPNGGLEWNLAMSTDPEIMERSLLTELCTTSPGKEKQNGFWKLWELPEHPVYVLPPAGSREIEEDKMIEGSFEAAAEPVYFTVGLQPMPEPEKEYESAEARSSRLGGRIVSATPDPYLDMALRTAIVGIDGAWYPPQTMHSTQGYNMPFLGWNNRFGYGYAGWADRAEDELAYYAPLQNGANGKTGFERDEAHMDTVMGQNSRFYGEGHIDQDQGMYNMQSQFFDQMIEIWRMTDSEKIEDLLYTTLKKHTRWQDECFDPDEDGLYESYINTWPTDSVWYNGGGSCEETCYAYTAHKAAEEIAIKKGDVQEAEYHRNVLERIRKGFFEKLWIQDKGYPGMMVENGGHGRLHESAWQYNSFQPVISGLLDSFQSAMSVWYNKWGLENVKLPYGGTVTWMSNWVPSVWSVRKIGGGENFQQAQAFFQAGFPEEGWEMLQGMMLQSGYAGKTPGAFASEGASLLVRAAIAGLHGYQPDYPNSRVVLAPQYPAKWDHAQIHTSYLDAEFSRKEGRIQYSFWLEKAAALTVRLPIYAKKLKAVIGADNWKLLPGFGTSIVEICWNETAEGKILIETEEEFYPQAAIKLSAAPLNTIALEGCGITAIHDPQNILDKVQHTAQKAELTLKDISGIHICFLEAEEADAHYYQLVELELSETKAELLQKDKEQLVPAAEGETYVPLNIQEQFFADVRTIFRQKYVSPKPQSVCLTIGTDGYSPWTFTYWEKGTPTVELEDPWMTANTLESPSGIPFRWNGAENNVAFTSLWDNWPSYVTIPVGQKAKRIYLLVIGTTNPMQCQIANGVLRFWYTDGTCEEMELENPRNFWSLCGYSGDGRVAGQDGANDYDYETDGYCLPETAPEQVQLGKNCRGVVVSWKLDPEKELESVTLETLSQEVIIGLAGITLLKDSSIEGV